MVTLIPRRTRSVRPAGLLRSRLTLTDLLAESVGGILQRPGRSVLTMLGTVLGIGSFVTILGLTATTAGQISSRFNLLDATQVTVTDVATRDGTSAGYSFPADLEARASRVNGVTHAGTYWQVQPAGPVTGRQDGTAQDSGIDVYAASPGLLPAAQASLASGVPINSFHNNRAEPVALLGKSAAARLGITSLQYQPAVFIAGRAFTVIGILQDVPRLPALVLSVVIPDRTALRDFGLPQPADPARALVSTRIGAAQVVAAQLPTAISARLPGAFQASAPPDPHSLRSAVGSDVNSLFLLLAGVALVIGALGIANTTLVAILERTDEIGLRRALGARRSHILAQFLSEAGLLGTLGGLIGSSLAVLTVLGVSISRHWTAILSPITVFPAPLAGTAIGLLAGLYPSLRASSIEPAESLRR